MMPGCSRPRSRPQASAFGVDAYPDLFDKAAAMCQSIDNNQALVGGNKRLAWTATKVFLRMNGWQLSASADDGERVHVGPRRGWRRACRHRGLVAVPLGAN
jgi:death on curing protein